MAEEVKAEGLIGRTKHKIGNMLYVVDHDLKKVFHVEKTVPHAVAAGEPAEKLRETGGDYEEFKKAIALGDAAVPKELPDGYPAEVQEALAAAKGKK